MKKLLIVVIALSASNGIAIDGWVARPSLAQAVALLRPELAPLSDFIIIHNTYASTPTIFSEPTRSNLGRWLRSFVSDSAAASISLEQAAKQFKQTRKKNIEAWLNEANKNHIKYEETRIKRTQQLEEQMQPLLSRIAILGQEKNTLLSCVEAQEAKIARVESACNEAMNGQESSYLQEREESKRVLTAKTEEFTKQVIVNTQTLADVMGRLDSIVKEDAKVAQERDVARQALNTARMLHAEEIASLKQKAEITISLRAKRMLDLENYVRVYQLDLAQKQNVVNFLREEKCKVENELRTLKQDFEQANKKSDNETQENRELIQKLGEQRNQAQDKAERLRSESVAYKECVNALTAHLQSLLGQPEKTKLEPDDKGKSKLEDSDHRGQLNLSTSSVLNEEKNGLLDKLNRSMRENNERVLSIIATSMRKYNALFVNGVSSHWVAPASTDQSHSTGKNSKKKLAKELRGLIDVEKDVQISFDTFSQITLHQNFALDHIHQALQNIDSTASQESKETLNELKQLCSDFGLSSKSKISKNDAQGCGLKQITEVVTRNPEPVAVACINLHAFFQCREKFSRLYNQLQTTGEHQIIDLISNITQNKATMPYLFAPSENA